MNFMCSDYIPFNYIHYLLAHFQGSQIYYDHYANHYYKFFCPRQKVIMPKKCLQFINEQSMLLT
jgi:hypothetical protein